MITVLITFIAIIANAFGRRFAGGLLGQWFGNIGGSQVGRLVQAFIVGLTVTALAPVWWWGLVAVPLAFLGATAGFPTGMIPKSWLDGLGLVGHGLMAVAPLALGAWYVGLDWWWLVGAGVLRSPAYWLATRYVPHIPQLGLISVNTGNGQMYDPPPLAEFYVGGLLGYALVLTVMV